jgi:hypothetical protein
MLHLLLGSHTECSTQCTNKRNIVARSRNHCCSGKAISVTYSECLSVALAIQHVTSEVCLPLPYFSTLFLKRHDFREKFIVRTTYFWIFSTTFAWNISHSKDNSAICYHKCMKTFILSTRYSYYVVMKLEFPWQIVEKYKCQCHENPCSGSRVAPFGRTDRRIDGQTWRSL